MMNKKNIGIIIIVGIVVAGLGFYSGMKYAANKVQNSIAGQFRNGQGTSRPNMGMRGMMGGTFGQIISKDDKSITVKLADGGSRIVFLSQNTAITKNISGTENELTVGEQILVGGQTNQDGSVDAQFVQIGGNRFQGATTTRSN